MYSYRGAPRGIKFLGLECPEIEFTSQPYDLEKSCPSPLAAAPVAPCKRHSRRPKVPAHKMGGIQSMQCAHFAACLKGEKEKYLVWALLIPQTSRQGRHGKMSSRKLKVLKRWRFDHETRYDATCLSTPLRQKRTRSRGRSRQVSHRKSGAAAGPRHSVVGREGRAKSREPPKRPFALR